MTLECPTQQTSWQLQADPESSVADRRRVAHTVLVDRDHNILGCIDRLEKNGELIRLDGGVHWSAFETLDEKVDEPTSATPSSWSSNPVVTS